MKPRIRPATPQDAGDIAKLDHDLFDAPWPAEDYALACQDAQRILLVAHSPSGALAGFCLVLAVLDEADLLKIATSPANQRQGVGSALLADLLLRCQGRIRKIHLEVRPGNQAAVGLYGRHGWQAVGRRKRYYADGEDALMMALEVRQQPREAHH